MWILCVPVMCESESGFRFKFGFKAFWAGFGFEFRLEKCNLTLKWAHLPVPYTIIRIRIQEKRGGFRFRFMAKGVDSDLRCPDSHITGVYLVSKQHTLSANSSTILHFYAYFASRFCLSLWTTLWSLQTDCLHWLATKQQSFKPMNLLTFSNFQIEKPSCPIIWAISLLAFRLHKIWTRFSAQSWTTHGTENLLSTAKHGR